MAGPASAIVASARPGRHGIDAPPHWQDPDRGGKGRVSADAWTRSGSRDHSFRRAHVRSPGRSPGRGAPVRRTSRGPI